MNLLQLLPIGIASGVALYISLIDIREMRIPNRILFPGISLTLLAALFIAALTDDLSRFLLSALGGLIATLIFFLIHLLNPAGLGMGDVKFAGLIGIALSWIAFPIGLLGLIVSFFASGIFSILRIMISGHKPNALIPFAPFMLLGLLFVELGMLL